MTFRWSANTSAYTLGNPLSWEHLPNGSTWGRNYWWCSFCSYSSSRLQPLLKTEVWTMRVPIVKQPYLLWFLCTTDAHHRGASGESAQPLAGPSSPRMQRKAWVEWLTHISQDITEYQRSWTIHPTCCLKTRVIPLLQLFVAITTLLQCPRPQLGIIPMVIRDTSAPKDFAGNTPETGQHLLEIKGFLCRTRRHSQVLGKSIQF